MNNAFKGARPKDKNSCSRQPSRTRQDSLETTSQLTVSRESSTVLERATPLDNDVDELTGAAVVEQVSSGYVLAPKPKVTCIPPFKELSALKRVCSLRLNGNEDVKVVYKGKDIEDSSLSVLFVGSKSQFDLNKIQTGLARYSALLARLFGLIPLPTPFRFYKLPPIRRRSKQTLRQFGKSKFGVERPVQFATPLKY